MRFLLKAEWPVEAGNAAMKDASQIPALAEPWFHAFNASLEIVPVMVSEDLKKAGPAIEQAVKKYG